MVKFTTGLVSSILFAILVGGCAYTSRSSQPAIEPGRELRIYQSFYNLSNGSRLYFQNGVNIPRRQLDKWSPYCSLYIYNDLHGAEYVTSVQPGIFLISSSANGLDVVDTEDLTIKSPTLVAALDWEHRRDYHPSYILYRIDMRLYSLEQPDVRSLSCFQRSGSYGDYYPNRVQIQQALGEIIKIENN